MEQQKEQLSACGMSASYKFPQPAKREFTSFCTCTEASSYNNFSPVRRAVPFFCTEKRNQKACQGGRQTIHLHASVRLPPWIPSTAPGLVRGRSLSVPEVMRTAQNIIQTYQLSVWNSLPRCRGRCRAQRGGRGQKLRPQKSYSLQTGFSVRPRPPCLKGDVTK